MLTSLDPASWVPVIPPIGAGRAIISAVAKLDSDTPPPTLKVRLPSPTDASVADPNQEFAVWSGTEYELLSAAAELAATGSGPRWVKGEVAFYVQPVSGTGGQHVKWS